MSSKFAFKLNATYTTGYDWVADNRTDLNAAAKIFEGLVAKFKDLPIYRSYLGQTYAALGRLDSDPEKKAESFRKAREHLEGAIRLSPENAIYRKALADFEVLAKTPMR